MEKCACGKDVLSPFTVCRWCMNEEAEKQYEADRKRREVQRIQAGEFDTFLDEKEDK